MEQFILLNSSANPQPTQAVTHFTRSRNLQRSLERHSNKKKSPFNSHGYREGKKTYLKWPLNKIKEYDIHKIMPLKKESRSSDLILKPCSSSYFWEVSRIQSSSLSRSLTRCEWDCLNPMSEGKWSCSLPHDPLCFLLAWSRCKSSQWGCH